MKAEGHRAKAERIGRSLDKLSPEDSEAVIDGVMLAVTHWINFAFHSVGLTAQTDDVMHAYFATAFERQHWGLAAGPEFLERQHWGLAAGPESRSPRLRRSAPSTCAATLPAARRLPPARSRSSPTCANARWRRRARRRRGRGAVAGPG